MRLLPFVGGAVTAMESWQGWQNKNTQEREDDLKKLEEEEKRKEECYRQYKDNLKKCEDIYKEKGSSAYRACKDSATTIFAQCNAGKPEDERRRLQTYSVQ